MTALASHNGGRTQLNLNFLFGEFSFANVLLNAGPWSYSASGPTKNGRLHASIVDANGMPTAAPTGGCFANAFYPNSLGRPGSYVIRATGTGTLSINGAAPSTATFSGYIANGVLNISGAVTGSFTKGQAISGSGVTLGSCIGAQINSTQYQLSNYLTGSLSTQTLGSSGSLVSFSTGNGSLTMSGPGRYLFQFSASGGTITPPTLTISMAAGATFTSVALVHVDDELGWVNDPYMFTPQFLSTLRSGGWGVLRDLNWTNTNASSVTTWASRKPQPYFSYNQTEVRPSLYAGTATHSNGSTVAISSISYSAGTVTVVTATPHGQTGTVKMAVDGCLRNAGDLPQFNGTNFLATVVNSTTLTYSQTYSSTPNVPDVLGTVNFGITDYALSFNDPTYGNGAPVNGQIAQFYFDAAVSGDMSNVSFTGGNTCNWSGHTFTGGESVMFWKNGSSNLPSNIGTGIRYYVLASGLVAGTSFQFSLTPGGTAVAFGAASGTQGGVRVSTLNWNSTGSLPLLDFSGTPLVSSADYNSSYGSAPSPRVKFGSYALCTAHYDSVLNAWLCLGGSLSGDSGIGNYCPPEIFIKLCGEVGAHPWFAIPMKALSPMTDYVPNLYAISKPASWAIPRFEPDNEVWNSIFSHTGLARQHSFALWNAQFSNGAFDEHNLIGKVASTLGQTLAQMAGSVGAGYRMVIASQAVSWSSPGANTNGPRFNSNNYVSQSQSAQVLSVPALGQTFNYTKEAAYLYATHGSAANYITPAGYSTFDTTTFLANYAYCTASISAGVMTVTALLNNVGTVAVGQQLSDFYGVISNGVTVTGLGTGTGGTGTYTISDSNVSLVSTTIRASNSTSLAQINAYLDGLNGTNSQNYCNAEILKFFTNLYNYAQSLTNKAGSKLGVMPYEGGYGIDYTQTAALNTLYQAAKFSDELRICLTDGGALKTGANITGIYRSLISLGVEFPSAFNLGASINSWSVADPDIYAIETPSLAAIRLFNARKRRLIW